MFRAHRAKSMAGRQAMEGTTEERLSKVEVEPVPVPVVQDLKPEGTWNASVVETTECVTEKAKEMPVEVVSTFES